MLDNESIRREIAALGLPPIVLQIFDGTTSRAELAYRCEYPHKALADGSGFPDHLLPLWECGATVTAYDRSDGTFCKVDIEVPDKLRFWVSGFDGVVADVLIDLWEDEIADNDLADLAAKFGFSRWPQLVTALDNGPSGDYDSWRALLRTSEW